MAEEAKGEKKEKKKGFAKIDEDLGNLAGGLESSIDKLIYGDEDEDEDKEAEE